MCLHDTNRLTQASGYNTVATSLYCTLTLALAYIQYKKEYNIAAKVESVKSLDPLLNPHPLHSLTVHAHSLPLQGQKQLLKVSEKRENKTVRRQD